MDQADFGAGVAGRAVNSATIATASLDDLADELHYACESYRHARRAPANDDGAVGRMVLCKLSELPGPKAGQAAAEARIRSLGRRLFDQGGNQRMVDVYDRAVAKYDYPGVFGANAVWDGIGAWAA